MVLGSDGDVGDPCITRREGFTRSTLALGVLAFGVKEKKGYSSEYTPNLLGGFKFTLGYLEQRSCDFCCGSFINK